MQNEHTIGVTLSGQLKISMPSIYDLGCNNKAKSLTIYVGGNPIHYCISYETVVACIEDGTPHVINRQSNTTCRHIDAFLMYHGFPKGYYKKLETEVLV